MSRSKQKGTAWETAVVAYLREALADERIERRTLSGSHDRGDVAGVTCWQQRVVIEAKNCARQEMAEWLREAEAERANDDALAGIVVSKRRGIGTTRMPEQMVSMHLRDLVALITGTRD